QALSPLTTAMPALPAIRRRKMRRVSGSSKGWRSISRSWYSSTRSLLDAESDVQMRSARQERMGTLGRVGCRAAAARAVWRRRQQHVGHLFGDVALLILAVGEPAQEGEELVLGDLEDAPQLGDRVWMLVYPQVHQRVLFLVHHVQRRGLTAAPVAAGP